MTVRTPRFTFRLSFSEEPDDDLGCVTPRDHPFDVIHGDTRGTKRQTQGSDQLWTGTVEPDSTRAVTITLPETTSCSAIGAICAADGRKLSNARRRQ